MVKGDARSLDYSSYEQAITGSPGDPDVGFFEKTGPPLDVD